MVFRRLALPLIFAAGAFAQTSGGTTVTRSSSFPAAGLATSETAQVNVTNLASNPASGTAASCAGRISFVNAAGAAIGSATPFTVTSGQTFSAKLPFANSLGSGPRVVIRAVVSLTFASSSNPPCALDTSFETFDSTTGVTHIYLTGSAFEALPALRGR